MTRGGVARMSEAISGVFRLHLAALMRAIWAALARASKDA